MNDRFQLEIVTPKGMIFSGEVKSAQFPGKEGEFGVLPGHAALVTLLSAGLIEVVHLDNEKDIVAINWGYVKVDESKVSVLADGAVYVGGKSESAIAESLSKAKELIDAMGGESSAYATTIAKMETMVRSK
ncbi:ATP synthase F1 subunit epsilon [Campylobacter geochelonis]|uniref:ATP synthase epsilon chain n=1 Tax=Campylobacter geochelonis TaxID=1780362 RepID=A0A128EP38_9BACT|nr:ATP synthase F1 subunit epsilon [Campylobacter geochelonis]QKF70700.1 ATP synthase, F1 complex, epsilon subunit [Campylobacter geochelonis]CZE45762.1 F0F1 ATP synthase subunit epsilon [Campylobacter geochelonis]CZE46884.1 F0F1 ATP synthase subunit epsilon [Campylobacter geochelonis]CZE50255.1 F0F1 ATP synthase subunit epsilon [Campylobacter geochelonis]